MENKIYYERKLKERQTPENLNPNMEDVMKSIYYKGRDNARVPMQVGERVLVSGY